MFSKFTSILHHAVEALAPNMPLQQDFITHWKAITRYFIENKDHKVSIEHTIIPAHLDQMLKILVEEEVGNESGTTGPCMEYMLQHRILETLYTLARTDCPPGMKQLVLQFFTKLLSRIRQPLLPHVNVHKVVHRLIRVCGEVKAAPSETEEIEFLCTVCAKLKIHPYLVNFFIENPKVRIPQRDAKPGQAGDADTTVIETRPQFYLVESLLNLMHSPDARVGVKACEGLMLVGSLSEDNSANCIVQHTRFCQELTNQLCKLYDKLPKEMDPADIESVEAKWGLDVMCSTEDYHNFEGKRSLISFLSWLDFCDQLIEMAHPITGRGLAKAISQDFLQAVLQPAILQPSEAGAVTATAHLNRCVRLTSSEPLLKEMVVYILGDDRSPEKQGCNDHKLRHRLIERCDHLSEEMSLTSLKLLETLLLKPEEHILHNLVLRNLLGRDYASSQHQGALHEEASQTDSGVSSDSGKGLEKENKEEASGGLTEMKREETMEKEREEQDEITKDEKCSSESTGQNDHDLKSSDKTDIPEIDDSSSDRIQETEERKDSISSDLEAELDSLGLETSPPLSPTSGSPRNGPNVHNIVNSFLNMVPEDAKSSYQMDDSGYDTYLRDAHRQFSDTCVQCAKYDWPKQPVSDPSFQQEKFFEGSFLHILLDKMARMLNQSYDTNLQVTSVVSHLALLPHPNLHEYLLNTLLPLQPGARSLTTAIHRVVRDVQSRMKQTGDFQRQLVSVRRQLMGMNDNIRRTKGGSMQSGVDDSAMLEGVIVLEEFCKELAAITFVKQHALSS